MGIFVQCNNNKGKKEPNMYILYNVSYLNIIVFFRQAFVQIVEVYFSFFLMFLESVGGGGEEGRGPAPHGAVVSTKIQGVFKF